MKYIHRIPNNNHIKPNINEFKKCYKDYKNQTNFKLSNII